MSASKNISRSFTYYDLLTACQQTGCPVCRMGAQSAKRHLKSLFDENVNVPDSRDSILKTLGFCYEHVQLLLHTRIADSLGASLIYENVIKKVLREFPTNISTLPTRPRDRSELIGRFVSASGNQGKCVVCEHRSEAIIRLLDELARSLDSDELRSALKGSDGICLPHLAHLFEQIPDQNHLAFLLDLTREKLETRQQEMSELIRKNDHNFRSEEITHAEALAWKNSMCMLTGASISPTGDKHG